MSDQKMDPQTRKRAEEIQQMMMKMDPRTRKRREEIQQTIDIARALGEFWESTQKQRVEAGKGRGKQAAKKAEPTRKRAEEIVLELKRSRCFERHNVTALLAERMGLSKTTARKYLDEFWPKEKRN